MTSTHKDRLRAQIRVADGFVPRTTCQDIVRSLNPAAFRDATISYGDDVSASRTVAKDIRNVLVHDSSSIALQVNGTLQRIVSDVIEPFYGLQIDYWERPDILVYPPGGFYVPHNDGEDVHHDPERFVWEWRRTLDRDISVVWYLNEEFDGGELVFLPFQQWIRPTTGMVVTFPSTHEYVHTAKPVIRGMRYAVATWMAAVGTLRVESTPPARVQNRSWQQ
jgi:predicted 2-oxoglutarate/Fe(II)-dependent dioxygenase YbiX